MDTITKRDLVIRISNQLGRTQQEIMDVVQATLDNITESLASGDQVVMRNFGAFQLRVTKAKIGRNPNRPEDEVTIPPRAVVKFKPGKEMKDKVAQILPRIENSASR